MEKTRLYSDGRAGTRKRGRRKGSQIIGDPMRGTILVLLQTGPEWPAANKQRARAKDCWSLLHFINAVQLKIISQSKSQSSTQ